MSSRPQAQHPTSKYTNAISKNTSVTIGLLLALMAAVCAPTGLLYQSMGNRFEKMTKTLEAQTAVLEKLDRKVERLEDAQKRAVSEQHFEIWTLKLQRENPNLRIPSPR